MSSNFFCRQSFNVKQAFHFYIPLLLPLFNRFLIDFQVDSKKVIIFKLFSSSFNASVHIFHIKKYDLVTLSIYLSIYLSLYVHRYTHTHTHTNTHTHTHTHTHTNTHYTLICIFPFLGFSLSLSLSIYIYIYIPTTRAG